MMLARGLYLAPLWYAPATLLTGANLFETVVITPKANLANWLPIGWATVARILMKYLFKNISIN